MEAFYEDTHYTRFEDFINNLETPYPEDLRKGIRSAFKNPEVDMRKLRATSGDSYLLIEQGLSVAGVVVGYIDVVEAVKRGKKVSVVDHKFTSSKNYIPSEEAAKQDPQTVIYAKAVCEAFDLEEITFVFDYYGTASMWHLPVEFKLTRVEVDVRWSDMESVILDVLNNYTISDQTKVPRNFFACADFGGCPFSEQCFGAFS